MLYLSKDNEDTIVVELHLVWIWQGEPSCKPRRLLMVGSGIDVYSLSNFHIKFHVLVHNCILKENIVMALSNIINV